MQFDALKTTNQLSYLSSLLFNKFSFIRMLKFDSYESNFNSHQIRLRLIKCSLCKEFSRIVCVSLFSYQGCFAASSLRQPIQIITFRRFCQELFSKVFLKFPKCCAAVIFLSVSATRLLYHKFSRLSTVNSNFLKTNLFFSFSEAIPCDSLFILPLPQGEVKHFLQKFSYFFVQDIFTIECLYIYDFSAIDNLPYP